ncbi:autotransporter domain-containing protein [Pseudomonas sp. MWU13-2625]|nr:autotransporter domain-containing protein [Pseudomonas sp. MWU13-2625]
MPIHTYKLQHLVLAVALAVGCVEFSLAEQTEPQVNAEVKPKKPRKKTEKPVTPKPMDAGETAEKSDPLPEKTADRAQTPVAPGHPPGEAPPKKIVPTENGSAIKKSIQKPASSPDPVQAKKPETSPAPAPEPARQIVAPDNAAVEALQTADQTATVIALDQLAAGSNANLAKATLSSVNPVSASMLSAMHQLDNRNAAQGSGNAPRLAAGGEGNGRVWLQALGHGGKVDRDVDSVLKHSTQGLILGADWRLDEQWHVGLMGAKAQTRFDARHFDGDLDSWHLGAYALRQDGPFALRLGASYGHHDGNGKRRVDFNGFSDRLKSSYDASTQQVFAEVGYNLGRGNVSIEPFASVGYQRYQRDGYTEKGGDAALKVHGQTRANPSSTLGLRMANTSHLSNGMQLTPRLSASVKHTYGELDNETRQQLVRGGKSFEVTGAEMDRNSFTLDAGVDLTLSARNTLGIGLTGEAGNDSRSYGVTGQWRMAF